MGAKDPKAAEPAKELQTVQSAPLSYRDIEQIGKAFVASGMFGKDVDRVSKAITKIMAGQELGMAPFAAMRAVHVIEGNATLSANTMAAMVKRSGKYDYEVNKKTADGCEITYYEIRAGKRYKIGTETFDADEARTAGLMNKNNWRNYPKAMMFARCMSNGVRTYCPDVFSGMLVYTPDEMGGAVDEGGTYTGDMDKVIDMDPETGDVKQPEPDQEPEPEQEEAPGVPYDPSEQPGSEEISSAHQPAPEPEPRIEVDADFKDATMGMLDTLGLTAMGRMRILKQTTGKVTDKSLTDQNWRDLYTAVEKYLNEDEPIPAEWLPKGKEVPANVDVETGEILEEGDNDDGGN